MSNELKRPPAIKAGFFRHLIFGPNTGETMKTLLDTPPPPDLEVSLKTHFLDHNPSSGVAKTTEGSLLEDGIPNIPNKDFLEGEDLNSASLIFEVKQGL